MRCNNFDACANNNSAVSMGKHTTFDEIGRIEVAQSISFIGWTRGNTKYIEKPKISNLLNQLSRNSARELSQDLVWQSE